jgi:AraC-like ligand binding domain
MSGHAVAQLDDIDEISDGRCPWRPVRHHFGITSFGVNAWTAREAGDRIVNEHDELTREPGHLRADDVEEDANEELYLVHRGHARFELDGEEVHAPAGTFVFVPPGVKRTAFAEEPGRRSSCSAASRERHTNLSAGRSGGRSTLSTSRASGPRLPIADAS